jgi:hypothetical protein
MASRVDRSRRVSTRALLLGVASLSAACATNQGHKDTVRAAQPDPAAVAHEWRVRHGGIIERTWGVQVVGIRLTASDWMIEFKYRVTDPVKATALLGRQAKPYLTDRPSGAKLAVPAMENVGELRQAADPDKGRDYFILFGNANKLVHRGNLVDVEVGAFRAEGLTVE